MTLIDPIGYDPHPRDEEWAALTCDICGGQPVTLCAGMCDHYCDDHGPDDEDADRPDGSER